MVKGLEIVRSTGRRQGIDLHGGIAIGLKTATWTATWILLASSLGLSPLLANPTPTSPDTPSSTPPTPPKPLDLPALDLRVEPRIDLKVDPKISPLKQTLPQNADPELGIIRPTPSPPPVSPPATAPAKNPPAPNPAPNLEDSTDFDSELGTIKIRPTPPPPQKQPRPKSLYLLGRFDYFQSNNVLASNPLTTDGSLRSGLSLYYAPALGPRTYLLAIAESSLLRYGTVSRLNYDELRLKVGIYQQLTPRVTGELGWSYQQLTSAKENLLNAYQGARFFNEHSLRFDLSRQDSLNDAIKLTTGYQVRWNLTGDVERYNRLVNSGFVSLSYKMSPRMQAGIDYQASWTHFLQQSRDDVSHYLGTRLSYSLNDRVSLNAFAGRSLGSSSDSRLSLNSWVFGVGFGFNVPLF